MCTTCRAGKHEHWHLQGLPGRCRSRDKTLCTWHNSRLAFPRRTLVGDTLIHEHSERSETDRSSQRAQFYELQISNIRARTKAIVSQSCWPDPELNHESNQGECECSRLLRLYQSVVPELLLFTTVSFVALLERFSNRKQERDGWWNGANLLEHSGKLPADENTPRAAANYCRLFWEFYTPHISQGQMYFSQNARPQCELPDTFITAK